MSRNWTIPAGTVDELGNPLLHEQSLMNAPGGAWVDSGLVELIDLLWAAGVKTRLSCQGEEEPHPVHGRIPAYIEFATDPDAWRFLDGCDSGLTVILVGRHGHLRAEWRPQDTEKITKLWRDRAEGAT